MRVSVTLAGITRTMIIISASKPTAPAFQAKTCVSEFGRLRSSSDELMANNPQRLAMLMGTMQQASFATARAADGPATFFHCETVGMR